MTKQLLLVLTMSCMCCFSLFAQDKLITKNGTVHFVSKTNIETIQAENHQTGSILYKDKKMVAFSVPMRSFKFEKALMEEHFNEKYVHSDKYPSAKYKGTIVGDVDFSKPGTYEKVQVDGTMYFHGKEVPLTIYANIEVVDGDNVNAKTSFELALADYDITIPKVVEEQVAEHVGITIDVEYKKP